MVDLAMVSLDTALDFLPGAAFVKDGITVITGTNPVTGEQASVTERTILSTQLFIPATLAGVAKALPKLRKVLPKLKTTFPELFATLSTGTKSGSKTEKVFNSAKKFKVSSSKVGEYMGSLRQASKTKGNFDLPKGTRNEANFLGDSWVGPGANKTPYRNQPGKFVYTSKDGTNQFREPVTKRDGRTLANFQWKDPATGKWIGNGHMTITN